MSLYADDYGIVDTTYIVHACMVDPCEEHPEERPTYLIGFVLHVGQRSHQCSIEYPQRSLRDAAFEDIVRLVKQEAKREAAYTEDEDDD